MVRRVGKRMPQSTTSPLSATNWSPSLNNEGSPSVGETGSPSAGSGHVPSSSSVGERSPTEGHMSQPEGDVQSLGEFHPALLRPESPDIDNDMDDDTHRPTVEFNDVGQTVGDTCASFGTRCGKIARSTVPPHYATWKQVPLIYKDEVWRCLKNEFVLPEALKAKALFKANIAWKRSKGVLRLMCDGCDLAAMRKIIPKYIKEEDWELFIVMVSNEADWIARVRGQEARAAVKALHSTGRAGIARRRHEMEQASPTGMVTRTELFLATHVYQEIPEEDLMNLDPQSYEVTSRNLIKRVRELNETEKYRNETDLDRDAVAEVFGRDGRGVVRGMGGGVSKTELRASAVSRELLRQERQKSAAIENRFRNLEEQFAVFREGMTCNPPSSSNQPMNSGLRGVILRNMRNNAVALGRVDPCDPQPNDFSYLVSIDEVLMGNELPIDRNGTFADILPGVKIQWPMHSVTDLPV